MPLLLPALLGLLLVGPSVSIQVVDDDGASTPAERERLRGLLALRLLDAGMAVAPPGSPVDAAIALHLSGGRFDIQADARGARASRSARADPATAELALSHAVMLALAGVLSPGTDAHVAPAHVLALEVRGANVGASADALRIALVSQLLVRGWTLTTTRAPDRPSVCVHDAGELVTVAHGPPGLPCGSPVFFARLADATDDTAVRERVVGAAVALSDRAEPRGPASEPSAVAFADEADEALGTRVAPPPASPLPVERAPARLGVELRAGIGLALRAGLFERAPVVADPAVRLGLRLGRAPGLAAQFGGVLLPAREGRSNHALDGFVGAGVAWSRRVAPAWEIEVSGLIGAQVHRLRAPTTTPATAAPWGELALAAARRTRRGLGIHVGVHPAAAWTAGWVHYIPDERAGAAPDDVRRFQRSGWSLTFSLAISHVWRVR